MNKWSEILYYKNRWNNGLDFLGSPLADNNRTACCKCPFYIAKDELCSSPYLLAMFREHGMDIFNTINHKNRNNCKYYTEMIKRKKDIYLIKKCIKKLYLNGYVCISHLAYKKIAKKINSFSENYLLGLLRLYGFFQFTDNRMDSSRYKVIFTNLKDCEDE